MALGYGTKVAIPGGGEAAIERIAEGDRVLVGSLRGDALSWFSATVTFSQGAEGSHGSASYLIFEDRSELVCDLRQPLLRADNLMVRAESLTPGDRLLAPDGTARTLAFHSVGEWPRGVHAVAFAGAWNGRPDGHLISAAGVVAGDWLVELHLG